MRLSVIVKPKSKMSFVKRINDKSYFVAVTVVAKDGKANKAVIELLSEYFKVSKSEIKIVSGENTKQKIIELPLIGMHFRMTEESKERQIKFF